MINVKDRQKFNIKNIFSTKPKQNILPHLQYI